MPTTHLLYLHGFRSSPLSTKARLFEARLRRDHPEVHWWCPQLPASPRAALEQLREGTDSWPADGMAVVGSSLGGFYATRLAIDRGCRLVVLNPGVYMARDLSHLVGEHSGWQQPDERVVFRASYIDELRALEGGELPDAARCLAVITRGDEVLDWREMTRRYAGARIRLANGGDHAISDMERHLDAVFAHLGLGGQSPDAQAGDQASSRPDTQAA